MGNEGNVAETPWEDLRAGALRAYEEASAAAHSWSSVIPKAINFYFDNANPRATTPLSPKGAAYQQGRADMQQECVRIIGDAGTEWGDAARDRKSKTYAAYVIAALDLQGRITNLPVIPPED